MHKSVLMISMKRWFTLGASIYDVRRAWGEGARGSPNLWTNSMDFADKEGVQEIPKSCGRHIWKSPYRIQREEAGLNPGK